MSPTLDTSRPVMMLDGGSRLDLGIVRSLGLAGVPVHLLCADSRSITTTSRYVTAVHHFPPRDASAEERLAQLCTTAVTSRAMKTAPPHAPSVLVVTSTMLAVRTGEKI